MKNKLKICTICKQEKPLSEFYTYKMNGNGKRIFQSYCKKCKNKLQNKYNKKYYYSHLELSRERRKIYSRSYSKTNKGIKYRKKYQKTGKYRKAKKLSKKRYLKSHPWAKTYHNIMSRCYYTNTTYKKKGIQNSLSINDLKFLWLRDEAYLMKQPSIDRKKNDGNYTLKNCRYIEFAENIKRYIAKYRTKK